MQENVNAESSKENTYLEVNGFPFSKSLFQFGDSNVGMAIECVKVSNPFLNKEWTGYGSVKSVIFVVTDETLLGSNQSTYFHILPSELKTPLPRTDCA